VGTTDREKRWTGLSSGGSNTLEVTFSVS